jgi:hypothetical protein
VVRYGFGLFGLGCLLVVSVVTAAVVFSVVRSTGQPSAWAADSTLLGGLGIVNDTSKLERVVENDPFSASVEANSVIMTFIACRMTDRALLVAADMTSSSDMVMPEAVGYAMDDEGNKLTLRSESTGYGRYAPEDGWQWRQLLVFTPALPSTSRSVQVHVEEFRHKPFLN